MYGMCQFSIIHKLITEVPALTQRQKHVSDRTCENTPCGEQEKFRNFMAKIFTDVKKINYILVYQDSLLLQAHAVIT